MSFNELLLDESIETQDATITPLSDEPANCAIDLVVMAVADDGVTQPSALVEDELRWPSGNAVRVPDPIVVVDRAWPRQRRGPRLLCEARDMAVSTIRG